MQQELRGKKIEFILTFTLQWIFRMTAESAFCLVNWKSLFFGQAVFLFLFCTPYPNFSIIYIAMEFLFADNLILQVSEQESVILKLKLLREELTSKEALLRKGKLKVAVILVSVNMFNH